MGHIFLGQLFYDDEPIDYDFFRNQARRFGFDEEAYMKALADVPRFSRHQVDMSVRFYSKVAVYISQLSFYNIKINETLDELYNVLNFQTELMNAIPTPIFYKNTARVYLGGNKAFNDFLGLSPSDYVGKTTADISSSEYAAVYDQSDLELLEKQGQQVYEYQAQTRSGAKKDVIYSKALFRNLSGEAAGIIGVIQDITELKNAQKQLHQVNSEIIKTHTTIGYDILKKSQYKILKLAATIALSHHERWDGSGYPAGLAGAAISPVNRIVSIADVFDAISHQRCYKEAWPLDKVRAFLTLSSGARCLILF